MRAGLRTRVAVVAGLVGCLIAASAAAGDKPVVAVFDIKNRKVEVAKETLGRLGDYLAARLTATGVFKIVPRAELKKKLVQKKLESYQEGFDQRVQVQLGAELAAQKTLATQVMPMGGECVVTSTLYDLKLATSEKAGIASGACDEAGLKRSIDSVSSQVAGRGAMPDAWKMTEEMRKANGLVLKVWTDRGDQGAYLEGDQLFVFVQANRDCHLRLVYEQVDGTKVQIFPNAFYKDNRIKGGMVWAVPGVHDNFEFLIAPPFGQERITAYAALHDFKPIEGTVLDNGLTVIDGDPAPRGITAKGKKIKPVVAGAAVTTAPKK